MKHLLYPGFILFCAGLAWGNPSPSPLQPYLTSLLPDAVQTRETLYLTNVQKAAVEETVGHPIQSSVIHRYRLEREGKVLFVYLDRHRVRTLPETVGIAVNGEGLLVDVTILHFAEPQTYKPRPTWLSQFNDTSAERLPRYKHDIDGMSGATLSGRAVTDACRRTLLIHTAVDASE